MAITLAGLTYVYITGGELAAGTLFSHLVGADPGLGEGGYVLGHPRDEAVGLVVHQVELLGHLVAVAVAIVVAVVVAVVVLCVGDRGTKGREAVIR